MAQLNKQDFLLVMLDNTRTENKHNDDAGNIVKRDMWLLVAIAEVSWSRSGP